MKNIMYVAAIVISLIGGASLAAAQPDKGVTTGSESNSAAHANGGYYSH
jgi:hypothetical protein